MSLLYMLGRLFVLALFGATSVVSTRGVATRFGDAGDRWDGPALSCTGKPLAPGQLACAHRTLPCGTVVLLQDPRTRRFAVCEVLDRGPFGAILPSGRWGLKIHRSQPGHWRGIVDLAPAVAQALGHNGREPVELFYQRVARRLRVGREAPRAVGAKSR